MRAGGDSEFESVYEPLSRSDEVDIKRDYLGKLGRVMDLLLPPCETETAIALDFVYIALEPTGLAAAYFAGEFAAVGDWATGLEKGGVGR